MLRTHDLKFSGKVVRADVRQQVCAWNLGAAQEEVRAAESDEEEAPSEHRGQRVVDHSAWSDFLPGGGELPESPPQQMHAEPHYTTAVVAAPRQRKRSAGDPLGRSNCEGGGGKRCAGTRAREARLRLQSRGGAVQSACAAGGHTAPLRGAGAASADTGGKKAPPDWMLSHAYVSALPTAHAPDAAVLHEARPGPLSDQRWDASRDADENRSLHGCGLLASTAIAAEGSSCQAVYEQWRRIERAQTAPDRSNTGRTEQGDVSVQAQNAWGAFVAAAPSTDAAAEGESEAGFVTAL